VSNRAMPRPGFPPEITLKSSKGKERGRPSAKSGKALTLPKAEKKLGGHLS